MGTRQILADIFCHKLGAETGVVIRGPWIQLPIWERFSKLVANCSDNNVDINECSTLIYTENRAMYVDYLLCYNKPSKCVCDSFLGIQYLERETVSDLT